MAELLTIARPYAEAAFKLATDASLGADTTKSLASWSDALGRLSTVVTRPELQALLGNPKVSSAQLVTLVGEAAGSISEHQRNFLTLLSNQERLTTLPSVVTHFAVLRNKHEATLEAEITSAFPVSDEQLKSIVATLTSKYGKKITATVKVDNSLIGGVSIRVGDEVTDVSVRGKLAQLKASLVA
jgi:F-type H+-transporting ATPase subunit delta